MPRSAPRLLFQCWSFVGAALTQPVAVDVLDSGHWRTSLHVTTFPQTSQPSFLRGTSVHWGIAGQARTQWAQ